MVTSPEPSGSRAVARYRCQAKRRGYESPRNERAISTRRSPLPWAVCQMRKTAMAWMGGWHRPLVWGEEGASDDRAAELQRSSSGK